MDESSQTATNIKVDIAALDHRYAIVEPGEKCYTCGLPLLSRQFFVFPCQHSFHSDCLGRKVLEQAGVGNILCSDLAIKRIDEPFITHNDNVNEWAL
ncbi:hypothetical protein LB505_009658 [Fusarium chuoi]|nr:hypothetical protein LB505_009658 [Fusarium chuoi]